VIKIEENFNQSHQVVPKAHFCEHASGLSPFSDMLKLRNRSVRSSWIAIWHAFSYLAPASVQPVF